MLKRHTPGQLRRVGGVVFVLALTVSGSYAAWAAQSAPQGGAPIFVGITMTTWTPVTPATKPPGVDVRALEWARQLHSGEAPSDPLQRPFDSRCTPFLHKEAGQSPAQVEADAGGIPSPADGQIFLQCKITYNGQVVATPSLLALDGQPTRMMVDDAGRGLHYQLVVTASISKERFESAKNAP